MSNGYTSIILKDLVPLIEEVALDAMMTPGFEGLKIHGEKMTMAELSHHNSLVAMHNEGVREMALILVRKLTEEDGDDE